MTWHDSTSPPIRIALIPGDGIGPEVIGAAARVLRATGITLQFGEAEAGWGCFERRGTSLPEETIAAARDADAILFGAVASPSHPVPGYRSPIVALRRELDLYANIRPVTNLPIATPGTPAHASPCDLVVVRENTEDLYVGQEESDGETAVARRVITRRASARIARIAFELAQSRGSGFRVQGSGFRDRGPGVRGQEAFHPSSFIPPQVTIVHKANVLRQTCGLFRATALEVAREYPDVQVDELLVDTAALQLVQRPERFDVIVTTNLFGDILSDVACVWGGGLGMATSANIGERHALFEPVHGAAPDIAGRGIANPLAAIGCAAMLLEHLGRRMGAGDPRSEECLAWAARIRATIQDTLAGDVLTPDLGGSATTEAVTDAVIAALPGKRGEQEGCLPL